MPRMKLGDVIELKRGYDLAEDKRVEGSIPIISSSGTTGYHNEAKVSGPGVVTGRYGTLGEVFYVEGEFWPLNTALYVRDFKGNSPRFIAYFLKHLLGNVVSDKAAVPGLNRNALHARDVFVPEPDEQRRIAAVLSSYDDLIENNRKRIKLLERAARLLYTEWFVRGRFPGYEGVKVKDGVPEGWEKGVVGDYYDTASGGTPSRANPDYYEGDISWVKTQELNEDFIFDTQEKITELALQNSSAKIFPTNTLLVAMYGASIGRTGLLAAPAASNQACCALWPKNQRANILYAALFFRSIREQLTGIAQGAAQTNISQQIIKGLPMLIPNEAVMSRFAELVTPLFNQIRTIQAMTIQLTRARDLLLPRLMSGKVKV